MTLAQGEQVDGKSMQEIACLRRALDVSEGAELAVSYPTVEGDIIRDHYRLTPHGSLQLYSDNQDDSYSDKKWSAVKCYAPEWLPKISCP